MKKLFYISILLFAAIKINAQTTFAPAGSEWYQRQPYGAYHCYYSADTIIAGTACRIIIREALTADPAYSMGLRVNNLSTLYVYNTPDTVFLYNTFFHCFTPLYVFNVNDGDTIRLPIIPLDVDMLTYAGTDSTFSLRIDSVRMKTYDTANLKTIYTHSIGNRDSNYVYNYSGQIYTDSQGVYAERIGGITCGFIPRGAPYVNILDDHLQYADSLRCYNDPTLSVKLIAGICGIPPTQVLPVGETESVSLYPNPAHDQLTIITPFAIGNMQITDITGQIVYTHEYNTLKVQIDVSEMPMGIYFVQLTEISTGQRITRKFVKE